MLGYQNKIWSTKCIGENIRLCLRVPLRRMTFPILWIFVLINVLFNPTTGIAQEINCDYSVYISTHISTGSGLYRLQANNGINNIEEIFIDNQQYQLGCLGYSVVDKMIYALEFDTYELLRINAAGAITNLGIPKGLDTTLTYYSGDIFPSGRDFFIVGKDESQNKDVAFYSIDIFDLRATPLALVSDGNVRIQDMTRDPINGTVYGYDAQQQKIVTVSLGQVANYQLPSIAEYFTSLFFDKGGQLYGLGENGPGTSRKFYTIDRISGLATHIGDGPIGNDTDACSCPYTFEFYKKVYPQQVLPCQEITLEYTFFNSSGSARTILRLWDELPDGLTITDIAFQSESNQFNARINSGVGTNLVDLSRLEVLLGKKNKITVKARVNPGVEGTFSTQAVLENLPLALNPAMPSDNIETTDLKDPNVFEVISTATPDFENNIVFDCDKKTAVIFAPLSNANAYLWSNGLTTPSITVDQSGIYQVEMETDCQVYQHEIAVDFNIADNFVDLGTSIQVNQGENFSLPFETNLQNIVAYEWSADNKVDFSCTDCENPIINTLNPSIISLLLTDATDCQAVAEIQIEVNDSKAIFAPTVFSPNDDGVNDFFYLQGTNAIIKTLSVFDRWGNRVFANQNGQINDITHGWAGKFHKNNVESGVYIWYAQIIFADSTEKILSGTVTLLR